MHGDIRRRQRLLHKKQLVQAANVISFAALRRANAGTLSRGSIQVALRRWQCRPRYDGGTE